MRRNIRKRLQKLKSKIPPIPPQPTDQEKRDLYWPLVEDLAIGFYLGEPRVFPGGPKSEMATDGFDAYVRLMGYANMFEWADAVKANDPKVQERAALARAQLFAKFGVSWNEASASERLEALKRMKNGFPEPYEEALFGMTGHNGD